MRVCKKSTYMKPGGTRPWREREWMLELMPKEKVLGLQCLNYSLFPKHDVPKSCPALSWGEDRSVSLPVSVLIVNLMWIICS